MSANDPLSWSALRAGLRSLIETIDREIEDEPGPDPKPDPDPDPSDDFKTFEIIDHRGKPDLRQIGLEPLKIWYEGALFDNRFAQAVSHDKVRIAASKSPGIAVLDIERWADKHTWRVDPPEVHRYIDAAKTYRSAMPAGHTFGYYSILPVRNYWDAVSAPGSADYQKWQRWNDEVAPICDQVDALFPSIYTFFDKNDANKFPRGGWVTYARANIEEARRMAPGKPVYAVLWPRYHPGNAGEIPGDYWRMQLDTCRKYADGVVIWDDRTIDKTDWSNLGDWWDVTEAWLKEIGAAG